MTKYFYAKLQYYGLLSRPNQQSRRSDHQIPILFSNILILQKYRLKLRNKYILILQNNQLLVNTLIYAQKSSLSSFPSLTLQYTLLITTIYPATTHLSPLTLYNPVTQQKVVTYVNNHRCFANYFIAHSTSANFHESLRKGIQYQTGLVSLVYVNCEVI